MASSEDRNHGVAEPSMRSCEQPMPPPPHRRNEPPRGGAASDNGEDAAGKADDVASVPSAEANNAVSRDTQSRREEGEGNATHQTTEESQLDDSSNVVTSTIEASTPAATPRLSRYLRHYNSERRKLHQTSCPTSATVPGTATAGNSSAVASSRRSSLAKLTTSRRSAAVVSGNHGDEPELWRQVASMRDKIALGQRSATSTTEECDAPLELNRLSPTEGSHRMISASSPPHHIPDQSGGSTGATRRHDVSFHAPPLVEARSVLLNDSGPSDELGGEQHRQSAAEVSEVVDATPLASMFWNNVMYALLALTVIAIAVGVSLGVARRPSGPAPSPPTPSPSARPTLSPLMLSFRSQVPNYTLAVLEDPQSPQSRALEWLAAQYEDESVGSDERQLSRLRQQFALAALFYATSGDGSWVETQSWLNASVHECLWYGCACVADTQAIQALSLGDNRLDGTIPRELGLLAKLQLLDLSSNVIWGQIPTEIGQLTGMTALNLEMNSQSGSIPTSIGMLTNLDSLRLNSNPDLTGVLPAEIGRLVKLTSLYLDNTGISGEIPTHIGDLVQLKEWSMNDCALNSTIPIEIGRMSSLKGLELYSNRGLTGPIPSQLGLLLELEYLTLDSCSLSGSIPSELGRLTRLREVNVSSNRLTGSFPSEVCDLVSSGLQISVDPEVTCSCNC